MLGEPSRYIIQASRLGRCLIMPKCRKYNWKHFYKNLQEDSNSHSTRSSSRTLRVTGTELTRQTPRRPSTETLLATSRRHAARLSRASRRPQLQRAARPPTEPRCRGKTV